MLQYETGREHSGNAQTVKLVIGAYLLIRKTNGSTQRAFNLDPWKVMNEENRQRQCLNHC